MLEHYLAFSALVGILVGAPLMLVLVLALLVQTWSFSRRLDEYFFNTKYFTEEELGIFDHFPWSVLKTLAYLRFITFPTSMKRRFGEETALDKITTFDHLFARATMIILIVTCFIVFNMVVAVLIFLAQDVLKGSGA